MLAALWLTRSDFKERLVSIWALIAFALLGLGFQVFNPATAFLDLLPGLAVVLILWGSVWIIFRLRGHKQIMDQVLGWGDVCMFVALACWFPSAYLILFFCLNFVLASLIFGVLLLTKKIPREFPVPLAGILGIGFVILFPLYGWASQNDWLPAWLM